jgi:hypothetical protein
MSAPRDEQGDAPRPSEAVRTSFTRAEVHTVDVVSPELALVDKEIARAARAVGANRRERWHVRPEVLAASATPRSGTDRRVPQVTLMLAGVLAVSVVALIGPTRPSDRVPEGNRSANGSPPAVAPTGPLPDTGSRAPTPSRAAGRTVEPNTGNEPRASSDATKQTDVRAGASTVGEGASSRASAGPKAAPALAATAATSWIGWRRDPTAMLYNVVLVKDGRRTDFWPSSNSLTLSALGGRRRGARRVPAGSYEWFVYAGTRANGRVRFGTLLAQGHVAVAAPVVTD